MGWERLSARLLKLFLQDSHTVILAELVDMPRAPANIRLVVKMSELRHHPTSVVPCDTAVTVMRGVQLTRHYRKTC